MNKVKGFKQFNEARRHRNKGGGNQHRSFASNNTGFGSHLAHKSHSFPTSIVSKKIGMPMTYSERFKYIINKIAEKNNAIAKELLQLPSVSGETFQYSYLDIESAESMSYLYYTDKGIPEADKYKSPKRQHSKVYKIVKSIFGSKYTKTDVTKFVSMYKTIFMQGPDKTELPRFEQSTEELVNKLIKDTKSDKLKWDKIHTIPDNMTNYSTFIKITDKKGIQLNFYRFLDKYVETSTITINLMNKLGKTETNQRIWLKTIKYEDMKEFFNMFIEKYEKDQQ